jgi:hypothetical protein
VEYINIATIPEPLVLLPEAFDLEAWISTADIEFFLDYV